MEAEAKKSVAKKVEIILKKMLTLSKIKLNDVTQEEKEKVVKVLTTAVGHIDDHFEDLMRTKSIPKKGSVEFIL